MLVKIAFMVLAIIIVLLISKSSFNGNLKIGNPTVSIQFYGFGKDINSATIKTQLISHHSQTPFPKSSKELTIAVYNTIRNIGQSNIIAMSNTLNNQTGCQQGPCLTCPETCYYDNYVNYTSLNGSSVIPPTPSVDVTSDDVIIVEDSIGLTSYKVQYDLTLPSPFWEPNYINNVITINPSGASQLVIPFVHNIIDGGNVKNNKNIKKMVFNLPNETGAGVAWIDNYVIGIKNQPPKFLEPDAGRGQQVIIYPWENGFFDSAGNPQMTIHLMLHDPSAGSGGDGDGSDFINDAYSKGFTICNIIDHYSSCGFLSMGFKWSAQLNCVNPVSGDSITSDYLSSSTCV